MFRRNGDTLARLQKPRRIADPAQPLIATYRRPPARGWRLALRLGLLALVVLGYGLAFAATVPAMITPMMAPIAIFILLVIWSLPAGDYAPVFLISPLFFGFFAASVLWPNYLAIALPGLPWITAVRLFSFPLTLVVLISLSASARFRAEFKESLDAKPLIMRLIIAYTIISGLTIIISHSKSESANSWLVYVTSCLSILVASCHIFRKEGKFDLWAKVFLGMCTVSCLIAAWEYRLGHPPWAGHIPSFMKIDDPNVARMLAGSVRAAIGVRRAQGTASNPLSFAELLGMSAPFAVHYIAGNHRWPVRLAAAAYIPLLFIAIGFTDSRMGFLAAAVSIVVYLVLWAIVKWRNDRASMFGPALVLAYPFFFLAFVGATFLVGRLRARVWGTGAQAASTEARKTQWDMGIPKVLHNPFGHGLGTAGDVLGFVSSGTVTIDSYFLSVLLDTGVMGFATYFGFIGLTSWLAATTGVARQASMDTRLLLPISVSLLNFVLSKMVLSLNHNQALVFMLIGAALALSMRAKREAAPTTV